MLILKDNSQKSFGASVAKLVDSTSMYVCMRNLNLLHRVLQDFTVSIELEHQMRERVVGGDGRGGEGRERLIACPNIANQQQHNQHHTTQTGT